MGTKNLFMLKTHFDSIHTRFVNHFVYGNMLWLFGSLRVFVYNYVLYSFGLIVRCIFRVLVGDSKNELPAQPHQGSERNQFEDSEIDGFGQELVNFIFRSVEDVHEDSEERDRETETSELKETDSGIHEDSKKSEGDTGFSVFIETDSNVHEDSENREQETEYSVFIETDSDVHENKKNREGETEFSISMGTESDVHGDYKKNEEETESSVSIKGDSNVHEDSNNKEEATEFSVSMEPDSGFHEDCKKSEEEIEPSVFMDCVSIAHEDSEKREEEEEETEGPVVMGTDSATTASKCQYVSGKDISGFVEEPTTMTFSFRQFYVGPYVSDTQLSEVKPEEDTVHQEEEYVQERRTFPDHSFSDQFSLESEILGGSDSYDEDDLLFNDNSFASDSESESSSSSGLMWGNSNKTDDSITYEFLGYNNAREAFQSVGLKVIQKLRAEEVENTQFSCERNFPGSRVQSNYGEDEYIELEPRLKELNSLDPYIFPGQAEDKDEKEGTDNEEEVYRKSLEKTAETRWKEKLAESDSEEEDEDEFEWEEDDLVEQMKMELRNARQGGLPTILEEEEEEETESPKVVEDLKPLKIEEKQEYKDQIGEIQKVHKSYEEKMRKLDILNYQTMHALGLLQLKDPPKLGVKPLISQNFWPRKGPRNSSDPLMKFVQELHRELELVYVGQVCLSWEILCWQHKKAQELKHYDSQWPRRYNLVAGEFQLFQVLMQRFIENEPFQGPRIQNYVKNRCVIRNLVQVPAIKDDSMKDKNLVKRDEEDAIASGRLAEIITESMRVFWEFIRADKDYGNVFFKVSQQSRTHLKDPAISDLLMEIRNHLQKKEKRVKDIVRSGNCIVKRFQKQQESQVEVDHEQLVGQVELKLISRVLNMSKLRKDQLIWCNEKLKRITFVNRKIQVEPCFLLFPY